MANYKVGDIIRLARKSYGLSQEELAFCSGIATETLSRIETGKHKATQNTYRKIMEQLNLFPDRNYAICTSEDIGILEEKKLLEDAENKFDLKTAGEYLDKLKEKMGEDIVSKQFVMRTEALQDCYERGLGYEAMINKLEDALALTVSGYEKYLIYENFKENGYPFTEQELLILMNLASAYGETGQCGKSEQIYRMILESIEAGYMGGSTIVCLKLSAQRNYARRLFWTARYEEAMELLENCLEEVKKEQYGMLLAPVLYDLTRNMVKINEKSETEMYDVSEIKKIRRQAYYIAAARKDEYVKNIVGIAYKNMFGEMEN